MNDWQPMDTAPRDDTWVEVRRRVDGVSWPAAGDPAEPMWWSGRGVGVDDGALDGWRPLPADEPDPTPSAEDMADLAETAAARPHLEAQACFPWRPR